MKLENLSNDELREISKKKGPKGNATADALRAARILWNRLNFLSYEQRNTHQNLRRLSDRSTEEEW